MEEKSLSDAEKKGSGSGEDLEAASAPLQRHLQSRHLQFIAIGTCSPPPRFAELC